MDEFLSAHGGKIISGLASIISWYLVKIVRDTHRKHPKNTNGDLITAKGADWDRLIARYDARLLAAETRSDIEEKRRDQVEEENVRLRVQVASMETLMAGMAKQIESSAGRIAMLEAQIVEMQTNAAGG